MLPDFPKIKNFISSNFHKYIKDEVNKSHILTNTQKQYYHEGNSFSISNESANTFSSNTYTSFEHPFQISKNEILKDGIKAFYNKAPTLIKKMQEAGEQLFFKTINTTCDQSGNTVNGINKSFEDSLVEAFEKMDIDFDEKLNPKINIIVPPQMIKTIQEIRANHELEKKFNILLDKKREEFHARENNRKLVD